MGGGSTPSCDITIDDVVKFIHDEIETVAHGEFPYTTWNDIPDYEDVNNGEICKANGAGIKKFELLILNTPSYAIGAKGGMPHG